MKLTITIENGEQIKKFGEMCEKLEDELSKVLDSYGLAGTVDSELTGNTTRFPIVKRCLSCGEDAREYSYFCSNECKSNFKED